MKQTTKVASPYSNRASKKDVFSISLSHCCGIARWLVCGGHMTLSAGKRRGVWWRSAPAVLCIQPAGWGHLLLGPASSFRIQVYTQPTGLSPRWVAVIAFTLEATNKSLPPLNAQTVKGTWMVFKTEIPSVFLCFNGHRGRRWRSSGW